MLIAYQQYPKFKGANSFKIALHRQTYYTWHGLLISMNKTMHRLFPGKTNVNTMESMNVAQANGLIVNF